MHFANRLIALLAVSAAASNPPASRWTVPDFHDLTLTIRTSHGLMPAQVATWYLKGTRQRVEHAPENAPAGFSPAFVFVQQCDTGNRIRLNPRSKTYTVFPIHREVSEEVLPGEILAHSQTQGEEKPDALRKRRLPEPNGPEVIVTVTSTDTGERRDVGGYEALHFKRTVTIEPAKGATTKPGTAEEDAWYLDLSGLNCQADSPRGAGLLLMGMIPFRPVDHRDHVIVKQTGTAPHGLLIEGTTTQKSDGNVTVNRTELVDVSGEPLDESLFEVPEDFSQQERPAMQRSGSVSAPGPEPGEPR